MIIEVNDNDDNEKRAFFIFHFLNSKGIRKWIND